MPGSSLLSVLESIRNEWQGRCIWKCVRVMTRLRHIAAALLAVTLLPGVTLQQMTVDEMTQQATAIVTARVTGTSASFTGQTIYTHYKLQITETLKGFPTQDVVVPGGTVGKYRQLFPGTPELQPGQDYLLFLWTSSTGLTHLMGLSQGVFALAPQADGSTVASRGIIGELMLDKTGRQVRDQGVQMKLADVRTRIVTLQRSGTVLR